MAGSSFNYDKSNPFFADEDVDDATFLKGRRAYESSSVEERRQQLLQEKQLIQERTIQSSARSIGLLHESEELGTATATELGRQREQLENVERKLGGINDSLRTSERHIQGIKSIFGSIKNYFTAPKGNGRKMSAISTITENDGADNAAIPKSKSDLSQMLDRKNEPIKYEDHPAVRQKMMGSSSTTDHDVDAILDRNLGEIGSAITRLKGLGLSLNQELDTQNGLLENINKKTEDVDARIDRQSKDMNKILKK